MYKYIYPLIKWKIKPWLKYYIVKKEEGTYSEIIASVSPIMLINSLRRKFIKFIVGGNSIQDGTPTPEAPVPIENVSGEVEVKVQTGNLIDITKHTNTLASNTTIIDSNSYQCNSTGTWQGRILLSLKDLKPNTDYTISFASNQKYPSSILTGVTGVKEGITKGLISNIYEDYLPKTFNTSDYEEIRIEMYARGNNGTNGLITVKNIQLVEGSYTSSTIPQFVKHEEQTVIFPLAEGQVLHLEDTLEADGIHQRRKITELTSDNVPRLVTAINTTSFAVPFVYIPKSLLGAKPIYQKYTSLINKYSEIGAVAEIKSGTYTTSFEQGSMYVFDERFTNLETARQLLIGTIIEIQQADEIIVPYTAEQQTACDNLKNLYSYKGTTHISSSNSPGPIFEVQYYMEEGA